MCSSTSLSVRCSTNRDAFAFCPLAETQHGTASRNRVLLGLQSRARIEFSGLKLRLMRSARNVLPFCCMIGSASMSAPALFRLIQIGRNFADDRFVLECYGLAILHFFFGTYLCYRRCFVCVDSVLVAYDRSPCDREKELGPHVQVVHKRFTYSRFYPSCRPL